MSATTSRDPTLGFAVDTNIVTILTTDGRIETTPKLLKDEVADLILDRIVALRAARKDAAGLRARVETR